MGQPPKRKSIFYLLLVRIFIIVLLFNITLTFINIYETVQRKKASESLLKNTIKNEILNITEFQSKALTSIASNLVNFQGEVLNKLISVYPAKELREYDLKEFTSKNNIDEHLHSLYIIENGIIVNTTFKTDRGLNFYNLGQEYRKFLQKILIQNEVYNLGFAFEYRTQKLRSYTYLPTDDKKYLIEIGSYSETANNILLMFKKRLLELANQHNEIVSLNLWIKNQEDKFPLINDSYNIFTIDTLVNRTLFEKRDVMADFVSFDKNYHAEFIYFNQDDNSFLPEFTVSIISDTTYKNAPILNIIKRQFIFTIVFLFIIFIVILIATRNFKRFFDEILNKANLIAGGKLNERILVKGNNELTTLAEHLNLMVNNLENSYNDLNLSKKLIQDNMALLQQQTDDMVESVTYAQRIQQAILPDKDTFNQLFPESFVLFKPRDIVSGDFYWVKQIKNFNIIVAADCTGHGIPGAFMSMLGISILNEVVSRSRLDTPGEILTHVRKKLKKILHQSGKERETKDGMDMAMCIIDTETNLMQYAGAFNPVYIYRNNELTEIKADRMPVGVYVIEKPQFTNHEFQLEANDSVYIFSDGFADQTGGKHSKKFMAKKLKEMLGEHAQKTMHEQKEVYTSILQEWMKNEDQVDDILLLGFKVI